MKSITSQAAGKRVCYNFVAMFDLFRLWLGAVLRLFRTRRSLMLENLALRHGAARPAFLALRLTPPSLRGFGFAITSLNVVGGVLISARSTASNLSLSTVSPSSLGIIPFQIRHQCRTIASEGHFPLGGEKWAR